MIEEFKEIHWKEVFGNVYNRALSHSMLHSIGDKHFSVTSVVKGARKDKKKVWVKYDRTYVVSYIAKRIIQKLQPITKEHLIEVISEAWDLYEELKH